MRKAIFLPAARDELLSAVRFYEEQRAGLGADFLGEVEQCLRQVTRFPQVGTALEGDTRRLLVERFPFGVLYRVEDNQITVVAVMHRMRKPDVWHDR